MRRILFLLILAVALAYLFRRAGVTTITGRVSPGEAQAMVDRGEGVIIDVREPDEWRTGVVTSAALLPLSDLGGARTRWKPFLEKNRGKKLFLYCRSGARSAQAASLLNAEGFTAVNIGSFSGCAAAGLPTAKPALPVTP